MADILSTIGEGLRNGFQMAWEVWWALILGFALSGIVQAWVSHQSMERVLGGRGLTATLRATGLGAASSSCSYAAIAIAIAKEHLSEGRRPALCARSATSRWRRSCGRAASPSPA